MLYFHNQTKLYFMEQKENSIFNFGIDEVTNYHLISIAKWNRFLSIVMIVVYGLAILGIVFGGSFLFTSLYGLGRSEFSGTMGASAYTAALIFYVVVLIIFLLPNFFRLNSSNKMLKALATQDQQMLNESLGHLKTYSKYWGILTIIIIAFYAVIIIFFVLATAMR